MIMRYLFLFLTITFFSVHADIKDHLKKAPNKSDIHSMKGVDFIYMINLDQRPEKWKLSRDQLNFYGIEPYRFSAVNGWELSLEAINDVGLKFTPLMQGNFLGTCYLPDGNFIRHDELILQYDRTYFGHCMALGTIGICLSHVSVLHDAYESGYETIWVMEDDIEVLKDPRIIPDLIEKLDQEVGKKNWDILFTDYDIRKPDGTYQSTNYSAQRPDINVHSNQYNFAENTKVGDNFRKVGARYGATSMIVRRSGMKKILDFYKEHNIFLPYDMDYLLPRKMKFYTVINDIVSNLPKALSDNGLPYYKNKQPGTL